MNGGAARFVAQRTARVTRRVLKQRPVDTVREDIAYFSLCEPRRAAAMRAMARYDNSAPLRDVMRRVCVYAAQRKSCCRAMRRDAAASRKRRKPSSARLSPCHVHAAAAAAQYAMLFVGCLRNAAIVLFHRSRR